MKPVRLYRPSNGTEGHAFFEHWCTNCKRDAVMNGSKDFDDAGPEDTCDLIARSMAHGIDDPNFPQEWIYGANGPECTAFVSVDGEAIVPRCTRTVDMFGEPPKECIRALSDGRCSFPNCGCAR